MSSGCPCARPLFPGLLSFLETGLVSSFDRIWSSFKIHNLEVKKPQGIYLYKRQMLINVFKYYYNTSANPLKDIFHVLLKVATGILLLSCSCYGEKYISSGRIFLETLMVPEELYPLWLYVDSYILQNVHNEQNPQGRSSLNKFQSHSGKVGLE